MKKIMTSVAILLGTDMNGSVICHIHSSRRIFSYSAFGHDPLNSMDISLIGFNAIPRAHSGCYLLGNGYRAYNPILMRFNSPDSWSPFGEGGKNSYAYCLGDPINNSDPSGHITAKKIVANNRTRTSSTNVETIANKFIKNTKKSLNPRQLKNHYPDLLTRELIQASTTESTPRRLVHTAADIFGAPIGTPQKFVINSDYEMVISTSGDKNTNAYLSHPSLTEILANKRIISAGTLFTGSLGEVLINNSSGHYRPTLADLGPAVEKLRELGLDTAASHF